MPTGGICPAGRWRITLHKLDVLRRHCDTVGRDYNSIFKTWSAECVAAEAERSRSETNLGGHPYKIQPIVGTPEQVAEQLQRFVDVGVDIPVVRMVDFPRSDGLELYAEEVFLVYRAAGNKTVNKTVNKEAQTNVYLI